MPPFPHIFVFRTIRGGLCLSYIVPCGTSGDAERGRERLKSVHHDSAYDNLSDELCLKLICYPSTEADSCPSAPLALKAVC